jgi:hypothetical protein
MATTPNLWRSKSDEKLYADAALHVAEIELKNAEQAYDHHNDVTLDQEPDPVTDYINALRKVIAAHEEKRRLRTEQ